MKYCLLMSFIFFSCSAISQDSPSGNNKETAYDITINNRAQKIVDKLNISDIGKATLVKNIIAAQYKNLNEVYTSRDLLIKSQKDKVAGTSKESINAAADKIKLETDNQTGLLHTKFIADLSASLTPVQVDMVKDGMTYGVLHVTYKGYNNMITNLTDKQKEQIMTWLTEARELAMDAESSEKKHACFGKYKGRINNYLSAAGYDLRKEGEAWQQRIKAAAEKQKK